MPDEPAHIFAILGPGARPGDPERAAAAVAELREFLSTMVDRGTDPMAITDALISIWIDFGLEMLGVVRTDENLRLLRRDLPKMAAAKRAMQAQPKGRPDA